MQAKLATIWFVVTSALGLSAPLSAHHSTSSFEITTPIWVKGVVVKLNWGSPHSAIIVEQVAADGSKVRWALENTGRLDMLEARGYTRDSFKPGDYIEACGFAPKRVFPDGTRPAPPWLEGAEGVITARLLLTKRGAEVDWAHYGPLDLCISADDLKAR